MVEMAFEDRHKCVSGNTVTKPACYVLELIIFIARHLLASSTMVQGFLVR